MDTTASRAPVPTSEMTVGVLMVFAAEAGFGTLAIFGKLAPSVGLSTSTLLLFRFIVATLTVWTVFGIRGQARLPSGRLLWIALVIGVIYGIMNGLFFEGLEYLSAGLAAIIFYTYPVYVFVIATIALNERPTRLKLLALSIAVFGVGFIASTNPTGANPVGIILLLLAAVAYATYTTGIRDPLVGWFGDSHSDRADWNDTEYGSLRRDVWRSLGPGWCGPVVTRVRDRTHWNCGADHSVLPRS